MIKYYVGDAFGGDGDFKDVHLAADEDSLPTDNTGVHTGFMYVWLKLEAAEDLVGMLLPHAWRFRISLKRAETWNNFPMLRRGAFEVMHPPIAESTVKTDVDILFWWRGVTKCI